MNSAIQHYFGMGGWPMCAVCCKPVERMERFDCVHMDRYVFRAYCHGKVDEATLDHFTIEDSTSIKFTWAFQRPALEKNNDIQVPRKISCGDS